MRLSFVHSFVSSVVRSLRCACADCAARTWIICVTVACCRYLGFAIVAFFFSTSLIDGVCFRDCAVVVLLILLLLVLRGNESMQKKEKEKPVLRPWVFE